MKRHPRAFWRRHEGLGLLIGGELGLRQDQALQRAVEDTKGGTLKRVLDNTAADSVGEQVALGRRQVRVRDQSLDRARPSNRHLLGELELATAVWPLARTFPGEPSDLAPRQPC